MIEINLLGHEKPGREFSAPSWLTSRNVLALILLAALGYVGMDYLPVLLEPGVEEAAPPASIEDILADAERLRAQMTPPAEEPAPSAPAQAEPVPQQEEPAPPPPVQTEPEPPAPAPKPEPPPPPPAPAPTGDLATLLGHSRQLVRTYAALYAAVLPGSQYKLLSVGDDRFLTELWSPDQVLLRKYQGKLKAILPEGRSQIGPVQQDLEASVFRAQIWGKSLPGDSETNAPVQFDNAQTIIQKISALAQQHRITMKTATTHQSQNTDGLQRIPVSLKLQGNDARSLTFLQSLDSQGWNVAIQKISARPAEGHIQMQMNLSVDVLIPAG